MGADRAVKKTSRSLSWVKWRVALLSVALVGLVVFMRHVTSTSFQEGIQLLFGDLRRWNWCPRNTVQLKWEDASSAVTADGQEIQRLCQVAFQPVEADVVNHATFTALIRASDVAGSFAVLEGDLKNGVFRANGLPFRSPGLEKTLATRTPP